MPEREATLSMRQVIQKGTYTAGGFAPRRLNLDDVGSQVGHELAAPLPFLVGQLQHSHTRQRPMRGRGAILRPLSYIER